MTVLSGGTQQREVLHVAAPDLENVGVLSDRLDQVGLHDLGNDRQAGFLARFLEQMQTFDPKPLELVWRGAWFEGTATQNLRTGCFHCTSCCEELFLVFYCAWPCDNGWAGASNHHRVSTQGIAYHNGAILSFEGSAHELVWRLDRDNALHCP